LKIRIINLKVYILPYRINKRKRLRMTRRDKKNKEKTLNGIRAEQLVRILLREISCIGSVKDWARQASIPESSLYRIIFYRYNRTPGAILKEIRYEQIISLIKQDVRSGAYCVALDSGFSSEAALRMFLRRCHNTNIRTLRKEVMTGKLQIKWTWLNGGD